MGSVAILVGLSAMYVGKMEMLSIKKVNADEKNSSK